MVGARRRRHFEPAGELGVNLHGLVLFELFGESALDAARVIDNMLEHGFLCVLEHVLKVAGQLLLLEQLLRIEGIDADALIFDAIDESQPLGAVDNLGGQLDQGLRIAYEDRKGSGKGGGVQSELVWEGAVE